ncbi:hypothetical protein ASE85_19670 [Sphingobium sp. Leaf26]|uniref:hypothetical protein n=1 Tax=Sphingobium sp. Leaf26 TaxID=1735693 RepID=UPI0006FA34CE|nr:hypothetical protein [Sphingobium sp. Leaf26]KQN06544.1 hypothetical protein ASE85_19670 [Sphingobium sp. Leaf26]
MAYNEDQPGSAAFSAALFLIGAETVLWSIAATLFHHHLSGPPPTFYVFFGGIVLMVVLALLRRKWPRTALTITATIAAAPFLLFMISLFLDI